MPQLPAAPSPQPPRLPGCPCFPGKQPVQGRGHFLDSCSPPSPPQRLSLGGDTVNTLPIGSLAAPAWVATSPTLEVSGNKLASSSWTPGPAGTPWAGLRPLPQSPATGLQEPVPVPLATPRPLCTAAICPQPPPEGPLHSCPSCPALQRPHTEMQSVRPAQAPRHCWPVPGSLGSPSPQPPQGQVTARPSSPVALSRHLPTSGGRPRPAPLTPGGSQLLQGVGHLGEGVVQVASLTVVWGGAGHGRHAPLPILRAWVSILQAGPVSSAWPVSSLHTPSSLVHPPPPRALSASLPIPPTPQSFFLGLYSPGLYSHSYTVSLSPCPSPTSRSLSSCISPRASTFILLWTSIPLRVSV